MAESAVILELMHSWGQLQLVMSQFVLEHDILETEDLSTIVHNYLSLEEWKKLAKTLKKQGCCKSRLLWVSVKAEHVFCEHLFGP